ncbi:MAG: GspE/PulE family protein [Patescibacteria group bacterium]|nr:GspE/PulE family protein [Patescibacteria group bacterium]MCL5224348.1 GspE/PulE family protein [Patescibacteria group bacterium]
MLQIPEGKLKEILVRDGLIDSQLFDSIASEAKRLNQNIAENIVSRGIITDSYYSSVLSKYFNTPLAELDKVQIDPSVLTLLTEDLARQKRVVLFGRLPDGTIKAAMEDPTDLVAIQFLENHLKLRIQPFLAREVDLNKGFALYGQASARDFKKVIAENLEASLRSKVKGEEAASEVPIVAIVDNVLSYAMALGASDIHIEIFEDFIYIRYRIDGVLREVFRMPVEIHSAIVARLKLLSGMKIDEHSKPQDGRFRYKIGSDLVDVRVSAIPTFYGEKIEMRILPATNRPLSFQELGMFGDTAKLLEDNVRRTYGMVLVTGPTGSGKTTTLYSVLNILNRPEVNIVTVEDPIEYNIKFINQTQINEAAGVTFAEGLRSILRQDPNVILVGEIRDNETADIAVQAALTGHLVLSTLHTNDAPTAIPRFVDLNVPPFLVAAVLDAVLAQRLVRKICTSCIYSYEPAPEVVDALKRQADQLGVEGFAVPRTLYAGKGCPVCGGTGYRGRLGIFELLNISDEVRKLIINPNFLIDDLRVLAKKEGMLTMFQDGLRKVERGITTIEELLRVIGE